MRFVSVSRIKEVGLALTETLGTPFLNPVFHWDVSNPNDRSRWRTQHDGIKYEHEPRVYHVLVYEDEELRVRSLWAAVDRAVHTPIERCRVSALLVDANMSMNRYVPWDMTPEAVTGRVSSLIEHDWRAAAEVVMAERKKTGKGTASAVLIRQSCVLTLTADLRTVIEWCESRAHDLVVNGMRVQVYI